MTDKKPKLWLERDQVRGIFAVALARSKRDFLLFVLMAYGLRVSEIVGSRRYELPGVQGQDLREGSLWVLRKGRAAKKLIPVPPVVVDQLVEYVALKKIRPEQRVFPITPYWAEVLSKRYAKLSGIVDWPLVSPHRLRAFFATDLDDNGVSAFTIRDFMDHASIVTTNKYVGRKRPGRLAEVLRNVPPLIVPAAQNGTVAA